MKRKMLSRSGTDYGVMGTSSGVRDINGKFVKIGDFISYRYDNRDLLAIVAFCGGVISPMGLCGIKLGNKSLSDVKIVIPNELVTNEIAYHIHSIKIEEIEAKPMTVGQIEELLGYPIEIVGA